MMRHRFLFVVLLVIQVVAPQGVGATTASTETETNRDISLTDKIATAVTDLETSNLAGSTSKVRLHNAI
jgi:hypothetical protein